MSQDNNQEQLVKELFEKGAETPSASLINLFDIAVNDNKIEKIDVAKEIGAVNSRGLEDVFNAFTALKFQHECPATTKETIAPELDQPVKNVLAARLQAVYK
jgi:D-ribose pyranose/furanose isomerase RbsD